MKTFENRDDVLTLLVHLGYLGFDQKTDCVFIPNAEVRAEFLRSVKNCKWNEVIQAIHRGGYARFSFVITDFLKAGENEIVVKAEDSFDQQQPRGKQRWLNQNFGCAYLFGQLVLLALDHYRVPPDKKGREKPQKAFSTCKIPSCADIVPVAQNA